MMLDCDLTLARAGFTLAARFRLAAPRFVALVGPSGAGKSTLLRAISGLSNEAVGTLRFGAEVWQDAEHFLPTHLRPIGMVFQEPALFPHLDVHKNLCFGMERVPQSARRIRFDDVVQLLGITPLLARPTGTLSGGERQRVALGRALLTSPSLLLCDEPLASLDLESRGQIMPYLLAVQRTLALPTLYVTHAFDEVVRLADEVIVLEDGAVRAHLPVNEALTDPALFLSRRDDAGAALDLTVVGHDSEYHLMDLALGDVRVAVSERRSQRGDRVRVLLRARDVGLSLAAPEHSSILNAVPARVLDLHDEADPAHVLVRLKADGHVLLARVTRKAVSQLQLRAGSDVVAHVKSVALAE
jgi:molybdate transport system ATP-binding protein